MVYIIESVPTLVYAWGAENLEKAARSIPQRFRFKFDVAVYNMVWCCVLIHASVKRTNKFQSSTQQEIRHFLSMWQLSVTVCSMRGRRDNTRKLTKELHQQQIVTIFIYSSDSTNANTNATTCQHPRTIPW